MPKSNMSWGQAPSHGQNTHVQGQAPDRSALGMHLETDA